MKRYADCGAGSRPLAKKSGRQEKKDSLDDLTASYKARLFGGNNQKRASDSMQALKRWFE